MAAVSFSIEGIEEVADILDKIAPKHAKNLLRSTVHGLAVEVQKEAKKRAPTSTKNLKKSIKTKRHNLENGQPSSSVYFLADKGFYWRFVEHGTVSGQIEQPFVRPAIQVVENELRSTTIKVFQEKLAKKIKSALKKQAKG